MAPPAVPAASTENEHIERPTHEMRHERVGTDVRRRDERWEGPLEQDDLSGFIGPDRWMVGKYER